MKDILSPVIKIPKDSSEKEKEEYSQILGGLFIVIVVMIFWGKLVFAGQVRLTTTLLPEITHPVQMLKNDVSR